MFHNCVIPPVWLITSEILEGIGLYTLMNYFGRYATCSHKDGRRSHIQSRETTVQEDHVTCLNYVRA